MHPSHSADARWHWPLAAVAQFPKRPKHARIARSTRLRDAAALALTGILTFTGVGAGAAANQITGNIVAVDVEAIFGDFTQETDHARPEFVIPAEYGAGQALNILVLGVDARGGENDQFAVDEIDGIRSDSTIVMHISADRQHVMMISIPRDSIVDIPSCPTTTPGKATKAHPHTRFNAAFAFGYDTGGDVASGALCTAATVEANTNVRLDGFVALDFAGFSRMVDALGGVDICVEETISAPKAGGLYVPPGCHRFEGWTATQFARARTGLGLGDGSDLSRIRRQQVLLMSIARSALSINLLTDTPTMFRFLNATTRSMTASSNFASVMGLASLGNSLSSINLDGLEFVMVPVADNPEDTNTVIWTRAATQLWNDVRYNQVWAAEEPELEAEPSDAPATPVTETPAPTTRGTLADG